MNLLMLSNISDPVFSKQVFSDSDLNSLDNSTDTLSNHALKDYFELPLAEHDYELRSDGYIYQRGKNIRFDGEVTLLMIYFFI